MLSHCVNRCTVKHLTCFVFTVATTGRTETVPDQGAGLHERGQQQELALPAGTR